MSDAFKPLPAARSVGATEPVDVDVHVASVPVPLRLSNLIALLIHPYTAGSHHRHRTHIMADASSSSSPSSNEIEIVIRAPSDTKLTVSIDTSKTVAELKEIIAAKCDIEKDRQRLIYSGKVLKDEEKVEVYKIKWVWGCGCVRCAASSASGVPGRGRAWTRYSSRRNSQCIRTWTVRLTDASCFDPPSRADPETPSTSSRALQRRPLRPRPPRCPRTSRPDSRSLAIL